MIASASVTVWPLQAMCRSGRWRWPSPLARSWGLGKLLQEEPERDDAAAADRVTEDMLRLFGLPAAEAHAICRRPRPDIDDVTLANSA
jgi:hypothetical protein